MQAVTCASARSEQGGGRAQRGIRGARRANRPRAALQFCNCLGTCSAFRSGELPVARLPTSLQSCCRRDGCVSASLRARSARSPAPPRSQAPPRPHHVPQAARDCHRTALREVCAARSRPASLRPGRRPRRRLVRPTHPPVPGLTTRLRPGDGKCVICDSYVRPATLVRVCDECNYGSFAGRCVICGGVGISDAYYCKECTLMEKDVRAPPRAALALLPPPRACSRVSGRRSACVLQSRRPVRRPRRRPRPPGTDTPAPAAERRLSKDREPGQRKNRPLLRAQKVWF